MIKNFTATITKIILIILRLKGSEMQTLKASNISKIFSIFMKYFVILNGKFLIPNLSQKFIRRYK